MVMVDSATMALFDAAREEMVYQGYDGRKTRDLVDKLVAGNQSLGMKHLVSLFAFYNVSGTKYGATKLQKMKPDGVQKMRDAIAFFRISDQTGPLGPDVLTINRLVCAYAHVQAHLIASRPRHFRKIVESDGTPFADLPLYYQFAQAPSIMDSGDTQSLSLWKLWNIEFSKVINKKSQTASAPDQYLTVMLSSNLYSYAERMQLKGTLAKAYLTAMSSAPAPSTPSTPADDDDDEDNSSAIAKAFSTTTFKSKTSLDQFINELQHRENLAKFGIAVADNVTIQDVKAFWNRNKDAYNKTTKSFSSLK